MTRGVVFVVVTFTFVLSACSEPLDFADWTIRVPEGVQVHEYASVPIGERSERIGTDAEMVATDQGADARFEIPVDLAVDPAGSLYVLDARARQVRILSAEGTLRDAVGRRGQGPGELMRPVSVAVVSEHIVVIDPARGRLVMWTTTGEHFGEVSLQGANEIPRIRGGARVLIGIFDPRDGNLYGGPSPWSVARLSLSDGAVDHLVELDYVGLPMVERTHSDGIPAFWPVELPVPHPQASISAGDQIYVAPGDQYQVVAYDANGLMHWALRVAYDAPPLTETMINAETDRLRQHFADLEAAEIPRPEALAAVTGIAVDGHGHIYVFPNVGRIEDLDSVSVDVYSPMGDRLFAGFIAIDGWLGAHDDDVFRIEEDEETGGREVVRYALREPF